MSGKTRASPLSWRITQFFIVLLVSVFGLVAGCGDDNNRKSSNPVPVLTSVAPVSVVAGGVDFTLTATGTGFVTGSVVRWNGAGRSTTFVSATQLTAVIPASDIASTGTAQVTVASPEPGGGTSSPLAFTIDPVAPVPAITVLEPPGVAAGHPAFDLLVTGTGFVQGATLEWNGEDRVTTFVSATQVRAAITAADVANPVSVPVTVTNPAPGGGTSNALVFVVSTAPMAGKPVPVTVAPDGSPPNGPSLNGGPSFLGRHAVFASKASNLVPNDTNDAWDVFVRDTCLDYWTGELLAGCTPATLRISVAPDGSQADGDSGSTARSPGGPLAVSFGGRYVAFASSAANLVAGDTNGVADVFMRDTCRGYPGCTPSTQRVSLTSTGAQIIGKPSSEPGHMRWDGEVVMFATAADGVVPDDANGVADVFMRGVCHDTPTCVTTTTRLSVGENGLEGNGPSVQPRGNYDAWAGPEWATFFSTASNFWPGAVPTPYYGAIFRTTTY